MIISSRANVIRGRWADSWTRVIGGKLFLFIHDHTPVTTAQTRVRMTTRAVHVCELEWDDFATLAKVARFTYTQQQPWSRLRHSWRASDL